MALIGLSTGTLHYREQGQGVPLICLHANPGDSLDFEAVMDTLAKDFHVMAIDWPGYGESLFLQDSDNAGVEFYTSVLDEFVEKLRLPPVIIIGNSVGGCCAVQYALRQPQKVNGLVLVAPGGFTPHNMVSRSFCTVQGGRLSLSPALWAKMYLKVMSPVSKAMLLRAKTTQAQAKQRAVNRAVWRSFLLPENDLREKAKALHVPTTLIYGEHDVAIRADTDGEEAHKALPHATKKVLPCGHAAFAELPELFLRETLPFMQHIAAAKAA
ncbi:MAG: alpha/beta hydrolase [Pseudomonadales bacterium]|nr:alpha/beta hydrolase [Pseudomonadales bacterium]